MAISIAPAARRSGRSWSSKQYVLAALAGTLAAIAVVSVVSVILCPAHIYFYLADPTVGPGHGRAKYFNFTLVANNTSRLTEVLYGALQVEVWIDKMTWIPAVVDTSTWPWQESRNTSRYPVGGEVKLDEKLDLDSQKNSNRGGGRDDDEEDDDRYPEVVIKAQVRFRYGHARSRLYNIVVSCPSVDFNYEDGTNSSTSLPVDCTA